MRREFDPARRYFLLEAFHLLGVHLFGDTWTGLEPWARPTEPPDSLRESRRALIARRRVVQDLIAKHEQAFNDAVDKAEQDRENATLHRLQGELEAIQRETALHPTITDSHVSDHAQFERREKAEATLKSALLDGQLHLQYGNGTLVDFARWSKDRDFALYINLSMIRAPRNRSSLRRAVAHLDRSKFEGWLRTVPPLHESAVPLDAEEQVRHFLRAHAAGPRQQSKDQYFEQAKAAIPDLPRRAFDRVWAAEAPTHWKRPGAPRKNT